MKPQVVAGTHQQAHVTIGPSEYLVLGLRIVNAGAGDRSELLWDTSEVQVLGGRDFVVEIPCGCPRWNWVVKAAKSAFDNDPGYLEELEQDVELGSLCDENDAFWDEPPALIPGEPFVGWSGGLESDEDPV